MVLIMYTYVYRYMYRFGSRKNAYYNVYVQLPYTVVGFVIHTYAHGVFIGALNYHIVGNFRRWLQK